MRTGGRWLRLIATAGLTAAGLLLALRVAAPLTQLPSGVAVTVQRLGYWQQGALDATSRRALLAALDRVRAWDAVPDRSAGPLYLMLLGRRRIVYDAGAGTVSVDGTTYRPGPLAALALRQIAARVEAGFHGELVTWAAAARLFPLRSDATVVDYETGLRFRVRRLAGSSHADVQPLTAADTAVMRRIYGGRWSWATRPILLEVGGHRLAASMNGMPHGAGSIADNAFPGHFCIHFLLSETHGSGRINPLQLLSVLRAAGVQVESGGETGAAPAAGSC